MLRKANLKSDGAALRAADGRSTKIVRSESWQVLEQSRPAGNRDQVVRQSGMGAGGPAPILDCYRFTSDSIRWFRARRKHEQQQSVRGTHRSEPEKSPRNA